MNKRILTLVLALVMVLGAFVPALAEAEKITNPKVQWLIDNGIVEGRLQEDGKTKVFDLDKTITREEITKLVVFHENANELAKALAGTKGRYADVAADRWSNGFINAATVNEWVEGYPDKTFGPDRDITYAEVSAILVRLNSKWTAADEKNAEWPVSYIKAAQDFGILKDVKLADVNEPAVREKVFEMMYNAFDGRYEAPIVNDDLGVISYVWADKIELNGDVEYTVTKDTIFVGESLKLIYNSKDLLGSLVRVAVDKDNVLSHVVVLGQDRKPVEIAKWAGIAKGDVVAGDLKSANNDDVVFAANAEHAETGLKVTDKTRVFVADVDANNYYEAKDIKTAIDVKEAKHLEGVYAAYDVQGVTDVKYARVIVFSSGKAPSATKNLRRVTTNVGRDYEFTAENTRAVDTKYTVKPFRDAFPYNYKFEKMDVVEFKLTGENGIKDATMKIDYSEDPVFAVKDVAQFLRYNADGTAEFRGNTIELKDEHGKMAEFALDLDGVAVFTHTLKEGNHVQVHFTDKTNKVIDIISIVDKDLKGDLPRGEYDRTCGTLLEVGKVNDDYSYVRLHGGSYHVPNDVKFDKFEIKGLKDSEKLHTILGIAEEKVETLEGLKAVVEYVDTDTKLSPKVTLCYLNDNKHDSDKYIYSLQVTVDFTAINKAKDDAAAEALKTCKEGLDKLAAKVKDIEVADSTNVASPAQNADVKTKIAAYFAPAVDKVEEDNIELVVKDGKITGFKFVNLDDFTDCLNKEFPVNFVNTR